jgi:hypothetical protein
MATSYKILGQAAPANTSNADLYTVPSATEAVVSTLSIANVTGTSVTARIFVRDGGAAAAVSNSIAYDITIAGNAIFGMTQGITLGAGDVITVQSSVADSLTFHLFGSEIS